MNDELKQIWLDLLQCAIDTTGTAMGQKPETIAKRAASIADAALDQYRMRFEFPPETSPGADGNGSEGE